MSVAYRAVGWNRNKIVYDLAIAILVGAFIGSFLWIGSLPRRGGDPITPDILRIRAFGSCALIMLTAVLCIGPLARFDRRFLPILYNRRHLGVMTFAVACCHAYLVLNWYHDIGALNPLVALLGDNTRFLSLSGFPFELLGVAALLILLLLAAISHDFWLAFLTPPVWKAIHMLIYAAYGLALMHVALGALQSERSAVYAVLALGSFAGVAALHIASGWHEARRDRGRGAGGGDWIDTGGVDEIAPDRARIVTLPGHERIAVFRYDGKLSAVSNVCAHQGGPLGEGRIIDGCITCPWHGFQYRPQDGRSPPPFSHRVATFRIRVAEGRVLIDPKPLPPGTPVAPAPIEEAAHV